MLLKVLACIALLLVFAGLFETLGFILSAALVGSCMAILYGAGNPAVVTASCSGSASTGCSTAPWTSRCRWAFSTSCRCEDFVMET
ncbi:membrane protein TctB [Pseudomonas aeruginosa]|nr:membrane protein TctB [Pseudomonas aeruginosa]